MIEFMVVPDDVMPAGQESVIVEFPDGHTAVFLACGGGTVQREEPITVKGVTFQAIASGEPFAWEWRRIAMPCGEERVQWNRDSTAYRFGYALCADDGTPVAALELAS